MATLIVELSLTRIFSVVFSSPMAFLAISIAMFGLGAGGVFSYVVAGWKSPTYAKLGRLSGVNSVLVLVALTVILAQKDSLTNWNLALVYLTTALPFFVSGTIVSLAISETIGRVDRIYFYDLAGAAGGCLLLIPLLNRFGGPSTVVASSSMFAVAAAVWHSMAGSKAGRAGSVAMALALVTLLTYNQRSQHPILDITYAKGHAIQDEIWSKWNSISRVAVKQEAKQDARQDAKPYSIEIDADAETTIANFDFSHLSDDDRRRLLGDGPALPYIMRPAAKTLILGAGGGWDVARALASGSKDVTAVEINGLIADTVMRDKWAELSGGLFERPEVHVQVEDGRSFVRRSKERYQVVQATLVHTWASTAAGAFALSENNLYTRDAFRDYLSHLTDDGVAVFTRWGFDPPRESLRLVALAMAALSDLGERDAWKHVIVGRAGTTEGRGATDTVLIARKPLAEGDLERARGFLQTAGMEALFLPGQEVRNPFHDLLRSADPEEFEQTYRFDITPVTDNRPYFFYTVQPRDVMQFLKTTSHLSADYEEVNKAVPLLFGLLAASLLATALIMVLPPLLLGTRLPKQSGVRGFLWYFLFIGAGYVLIEVGLIQKFVLFLGHPTYALTVVVFSLLASSGLGSFTSRRLLGSEEGQLIKVLGSVAVLAALEGVVVSGLLGALVWLPLLVKMLLTVALVAPLGFAMGMPFPAALRRLEEWHAPAVRWAWSLNAAASVLGSVGALICAIYLGLMQTLMIGGLFYLGALAVLARTQMNVAPPPEPGPGRVVIAGSELRT
jgi:hypothetical protein